MWSFESQFTAGNREDEVAIGCDLQIFCALEIEVDPVGIGAGRNLEVVFKTTLPAIKVQIDSGIKIAILHSGKLRNVPVPARGIVSDKVVAAARKRIRTRHLSGLICAAELHLNDRTILVFGTLRQCQYGLAGSQIKAIAVAV